MKRLIIILAAVLFISVAANVWQCTHKPEPVVSIERDTVWLDRIIREPSPTETIYTDRVVYLRVPRVEHDTIRDSIDVPIPIMQKRYDDSLYTAWVSGYDPNLDSIRLRIPEVETTITQTIIKPAPRFSIGPSIGVGYGIVNRKPDVFVGITATWNLWPR